MEDANKHYFLVPAWFNYRSANILSI